VHHCMVDGVAGVDLMATLLAVAPDDGPGPDWEPVGRPSDTRLAASAAADLARAVVVAPFWILRQAGHPQRAVHGLRSLASGFGDWAGVLWPTHKSSITGPVGAERAWAWAEVDLSEAKAVRAERGGTVNDVVLSAVANGLRKLLLARGEDPRSTTIRTVIPVSVRTEDGVLDNEVSAELADLPVDIACPELRYEVVRSETERLKRSHEVEAGEAATSLAGWVPPPLLAFGTRAAVALLRRHPQRNVTTVVTNVPGPQEPLTAAGRRMLATYPYIPVALGVRITVGVLSYDGGLFFGVTGDKDSMPDVELVAEGIREGIAELHAPIPA